MLNGIDAVMVEAAQSALDRIEDIARQAIGANPRRTPEEVDALLAAVRGPLVDEPDSHSAVVGATEAAQLGLPVRELGHDDPRWRAVWALWTRYFSLGPPEQLQAYESVRASQVLLQVPATD
jgi:hypothetical protein